MSLSTPATVGIADSKARRKAMIRRITVTAILTAMAFVLMYLEVPLPFMPPFLKFDFSEIPVLVGAFALGPVWGIVIELFKNLIHLPFTATAGIGELSNFVTGSLFVGFSGLVYLKLHTRKGAAVSMAIGTLALAVIAVPINAFITLPLYGSVMNFSTEAIVGMSSAVNPLIKDKLTLLLFAFVPFNLFKGIVVSVFTFFIYKPVSKLIHQTREITQGVKDEAEPELEKA
ncbi:MAG: ECF transporter S component [Clostridiales bacterium]|nr:ECF transporter S component [Clostridiales bacterium]MBR5182001.1 ECF transporter S component [Clostridiales bacterium]MBR6488773.1 ECF transporter S component [Clostridiales bacterium]